MDYEHYNYKRLSVDQIIHRIVNIWPNDKVNFFLKYKMRKIGFHVNSVNSEGKTALEKIVDMKLERITTRELLVMEALLKFGADPLKRDICGTTLARKVMKKYRDSSVTIKVLKKVHDIDTILCTSLGLTVLCEAINFEFDKPNVLEYILGRNPDVNFRTPDGATPLHLAAKAQNTMVSKILLERGADINAKDKFDGTPLFWAIEYKTPTIELVELFLEHRADMTNVNDEGRTLLHSLCFDNSDIDLNICRLLMKHGCDPNCRDTAGYTPLHHATESIIIYSNDIQHYISLVELFVEYGADLNVKKLNGYTLLHLLSEFRSPKSLPLLSYLINRGVDTGVLNDEQETFLDIMHNVQGPRSVQKFMAHLILEESENRFIFSTILSHSISSNEGLSRIETTCRSELEYCSQNKIIDNLSIYWYNILTSNQIKVAKFCRNEVIRSFISQFDPRWFPVYGGLMKKNFESGLRRFKAETAASETLSMSLNGILPYDAILQIISYVPTMDLEQVSKLQ